jgi:hypothetical protein
MTITIFVGDVTEYLAKAAKQSDPSAILITNSNYKNLQSGTYYTSLGDLTHLTQFAEILRQADTVIYMPPDKWTDDNLKNWTEEYLTKFFTRTVVKNFIPKSKINTKIVLDLADVRKSASKQLWIAGCSISYGTGIDKQLRYGQLLAEELNLPVSFLTVPGSSVCWAADQILRSDLRAGDIVVWGLTAPTRFPYFDGHKIEHVHPGTYVNDPKFNTIVNIEQLDSTDTLYRQVISIFQVINFCRQLNVKLIIAALLDTELSTYLLDQKCFVMLHGLYGVTNLDKFLDVGWDNMHPGVLTHRFYADEILKKL